MYTIARTCATNYKSVKIIGGLNIKSLTRCITSNGNNNC
jgi:hypothetical protein